MTQEDPVVCLVSTDLMVAPHYTQHWSRATCHRDFVHSLIWCQKPSVLSSHLLLSWVRHDAIIVYTRHPSSWHYGSGCWLAAQLCCSPRPGSWTLLTRWPPYRPAPWSHRDEGEKSTSLSKSPQGGATQTLVVLILAINTKRKAIKTSLRTPREEAVDECRLSAMNCLKC